MPRRKAAAVTRKVLAVLQDTLEGSPPKNRTPIKELLLGALSRDMNERTALILLNKVERHFVDWNEVRISLLPEIAAVMSDNADHLDIAHRIRTILRRVFDVTCDLDMRMLADLTQREATRLIAGFIKPVAAPPPVPEPVAPPGYAVEGKRESEAGPEQASPAPKRSAASVKKATRKAPRRAGAATRTSAKKATKSSARSAPESKTTPGAKTSTRRRASGSSKRKRQSS
jgi:hypothetical protein